jgi:hypothetical protein
MPRVDTIVVGGGIGPGTPFTVNRIPYIANVDPPLLAASPNLLQVLTGNIGVAISPTGTDPAPADTNVLRVLGGITPLLTGTNNRGVGDAFTVAAGLTGVTLFGRNITLAGSSNNTVAIGSTISIASGGGLAVGASITVGASFNAGNIIIGTLTVGAGAGGSTGGNLFMANGGNVGGGGPQDNTIITCGSITGGTGLFRNVIVTGGLFSIGNSTAEVAVLGIQPTIAAGIQRAQALGGNHTLNHNTCLLLGSGLTTTADGQCIIGDALNNGLHTIIFGPAAVTSANPYAVTIKLTGEVGVDQNGVNLTIQPGFGTGAAAGGGNIIFQTGGIAASGATIQAAVTRLTIGQAAILAALPVEMQVNNGYQAINQVDEAGADAGTLANAPAAGDPTFWLPVRINGADFAVPCWPV